VKYCPPPASVGFTLELSCHSILQRSRSGRRKGPAFFAYSNSYLIDVTFGAIVDVEASGAIPPAEVGAEKTMIERIEDHFGLKGIGLRPVPRCRSCSRH
jgi:hypothetical protein